MAVFKVHKSKDFTVMSNHHLRNKEISLKAKGLLTLMLSLPDDWDYSILGLAALSRDGKDSVMSALGELQTTGYINIESFRNERGQYESVYNVFENPNRDSRCGKSESDNPTQYNTNNESTDTNNDNNVDSSSSRTINSTSKNNISTTKERKKKGLDLSFIGVEFSDMMCRWFTFHKEIGKPYTQTGAEGAYRRLLMLSNGDARVADQIVEQSIANGWQGLFELKQQKTYGNNTSTARNPWCDVADAIERAGGIL